MVKTTRRSARRLVTATLAQLKASGTAANTSIDQVLATQCQTPTA